jgi:hypothetical protein
MPQEPLPAPAARVAPQSLITPMHAGTPNPPTLPGQQLPEVYKGIKSGVEVANALIEMRSKASKAAASSALSTLIKEQANGLSKAIQALRARTLLKPDDPNYLSPQDAMDQENQLLGKFGLGFSGDSGPSVDTGPFSRAIWTANPASLNTPNPKVTADELKAAAAKKAAEDKANNPPDAQTKNAPPENAPEKAPAPSGNESEIQKRLKLFFNPVSSIDNSASGTGTPNNFNLVSAPGMGTPNNFNLVSAPQLGGGNPNYNGNGNPLVNNATFLI